MPTDLQRVSTAPRIALIHAVHPAMAPVEDAFRRQWPEAARFNLLDDGLPAMLEAEGAQTTPVRQRIDRLLQHALQAGATAVLYTCSSFGDAIEEACSRVQVPVLKPNEAMFRQALDHGGRVGMIATFRPAVAAMEREYETLAAARGRSDRLQVICVPEAIEAAKAGDTARHDALVAAAAPQLADVDVLMLAHFSTVTALEAVRRAVPGLVLTAPDAAVLALRAAHQRCTGKSDRSPEAGVPRS